VTLWPLQGLTNIMVIYHGEIFRNQSGMATARESLASAAGYAAWFTGRGAALAVASARTAATRALARSRPIRSRDRRLSREMGRPVSARCAASRTRALASSPAGRTGVAGAGAGCAGLVAAAHACAAVGRGPHSGPLPQRGRTAAMGGAVGVGLGEVAEAPVGVDHVPVGVTEHPGGFGGVHQVVRVAVPVDLGQRLDPAALVGLVPSGPLVLVPVVRPADPARLLRVPRPGPVPVPAAGRHRRDAAPLHVSAADHRAPVDRRNRNYLPGQPCASRRLGKRLPTRGRPQADPGILAPPAGASPGDGCPMSSTIPASPSAFYACLWRVSGTSRGQAAGRDLCRGTVRGAALRGGPAGRRFGRCRGRTGSKHSAHSLLVVSSQLACRFLARAAGEAVGFSFDLPVAAAVGCPGSAAAAARPITFPQLNSCTSTTGNERSDRV
jgi:hypothetical protein